jgi:uncharacterized membrane protein
LRGARFAGHPIHPALVHFPLALWSTTWAWDVLGAWTGAQVWWQTGFWCLVAGTVMALPAAITGVMELTALEKGHPAEEIAMRHMLLMSSAFAAYLAALLVRGGPSVPEGLRVYAALALSTGGLGLLALGGWYGGRMVYEHGVGRSAPPEG